MRRLRRHVVAMVFCSVAAWTSSSALAADGSSGCGPAWYVFKDNSLVSSSLRNTTNGFLSPVVTFGMTSGTSNCAKHKIVLEDKKSLHFATMAYSDLEMQVAVGGGEHLAAFAHTFGCDWRAQSVFNTHMQAHYNQLFPTTAVDPGSLVGGVAEQIRAHPELARLCTAGVG